MTGAGSAVAAAVTREEGRRRAREELSDPAYQGAEPSLIERLWAAATEWLEQLLDRLGVPLSGGWTLAVVLGVLVVLAVVLVVWLAPARRVRRRAAVLDPSDVRTAADHRASAEAHAAAGEYAAAVTERMRALARGLEDAGVVPPRPGRTATELAAEAARSVPAHREDLERAARRFDAVHYGRHPATAADDALVRELDLALGTAGVAR